MPTKPVIINDAQASNLEMRILSYLGELRGDDTASIIQLSTDLNASHSTTAVKVKNFEALGYVLVSRLANSNVVRLSPKLEPHVLLGIVREWTPMFGSHPYSGDHPRRRRALAAEPDELLDDPDAGALA